MECKTSIWFLEITNYNKLQYLKIKMESQGGW